MGYSDYFLCFMSAVVSTLNLFWTILVKEGCYSLYLFAIRKF